MKNADDKLKCQHYEQFCWKLFDTDLMIEQEIGQMCPGKVGILTWETRLK